MSVVIGVPGKFEAAYRWARYLDSRGQLRRLITPTPYVRLRHFEVSRRRTLALAPLGAAGEAFSRWGPSRFQPQHQLAFSVAFDRLCARVLPRAAVFNGWSSTSLVSMRRAGALGMPSVLHTGSAHVAAQTALLVEEAASLGEDPRLSDPRLRARMEQEYEEADVIVVPSTFVLRTFLERGVPRSKLRLVPEAAVAPRGRAATTARTGTPVVIYVGRQDLRKGIPYLLEAFRLLPCPARLRLVGPHNRALIERLGGLPPGAEAVGPRRGAALAAELAAADVFVLPSVEDGFGLAAAEAMAAGLPVIVTANTGSADLVTDGVNGFVVPARDSGALTQRLEQLLTDDALRERVGTAARAGATRTWEHYGTDLWDDVFAPLIAGSRERHAA